MMRTWELDVFGHLEYTKTSSLEHATEFVIWHNQVQNDLFQAIAESSGITVEFIQNDYAEYNLQANVEDSIYNNCNLSNFNGATSSYITSAKDSYSTSRFSRNSLVYEYLKNKEKTTTNESSLTK